MHPFPLVTSADIPAGGKCKHQHMSSCSLPVMVMTMITMMITTTVMMMTMKMMIEMASVAKKTHVQLPTAALQW